MAVSEQIDISKYSYILPESMIAKYPLENRDRSNLLLYDRGKLDHRPFRELPGLLPRGSRLVFNNTRVIQARLHFRKPTGASIEIFCLKPEDPSDYQQSFQTTGRCTWSCLVGNARKWKEEYLTLPLSLEGENLLFKARIMDRSGEYYSIEFQWNNPGFTFGEIMENTGITPIPPYLKRDAEGNDREWYQTIYSKDLGSVAAPTAGLHFSEEILEQLKTRGIRSSEITLHVGAGTFIPVKESNARKHTMHAEQVVVSRLFLEEWRDHMESFLAVGTTSTRSLESLYWLGVKILEHENIDPAQLVLEQWEYEKLSQGVALGESLDALVDFCSGHELDQLYFTTQLMIVPGYRFKTISGLITNFHLPGSTLLLLIAAFIGEDWKKVYEYAVENRFRFLSYGDSSLLLPGSWPRL